MKKNKEHEYDETDETRTDYTQTDEEHYTDEGTEYESSYSNQDEDPDDENMTSTGDETEAEVTEKKKSKLPLILGGVFLAGGGLLGYNMFFNKPAPVQPTSQNAQQPKSGDMVSAPAKEEPVQQPVSQPQPVVQPEVKSSIPDTPVAENTAPNALPDLGAPVTPVNQGVSSPAAPVQNPAIEANTQAAGPVVNGQVPVSPVVQESKPADNPLANAQTQAPETVVNTPVSVDTQTPAMNSDSVNKITQSIDRLIDRMDGFEDNLDKIAKSVDEAKDSNTEQDKKIADLENRVSKLEEAAKNAPVVAPVVKEAAKSNVVKKSAVKKQAVKKVVRKKHHEQNSVVLISDGSDYGSRPVRQKSVAHKSVSHVSSRAGTGYELQAIVPGKAWVKRPNGTTAVYGIGDTLPNGNKVGKIDPNTGLYDSAGKIWISE